MLESTVFHELVHRAPPELLAMFEPFHVKIDSIDLIVVDLNRALRRVRLYDRRLPLLAPPSRRIH